MDPDPGKAPGSESVTLNVGEWAGSAGHHGDDTKGRILKNFLKLR